MKSEALQVIKEQNRQKNVDHLFEISRDLLNNKPALMIGGFVAVELLKHVVIGTTPASEGGWSWRDFKFIRGTPPVEDTLIGPTQAVLLEAGIVMWGMGISPQDIMKALGGFGGLFAKFGLEAPGLLVGA